MARPSRQNGASVVAADARHELAGFTLAAGLISGEQVGCSRTALNCPRPRGNQQRVSLSDPAVDNSRS